MLITYSRPVQPMVIVDGPGEPIAVIAPRNYGFRFVEEFIAALAKDQKCGRAKEVAPGVLCVSGYPLEVVHSEGVFGARESTYVAGERIAGIAKVILTSIPPLTRTGSLEVLEDERGKRFPGIELGVELDANAHLGDSPDSTIAHLNEAGNKVCARLAGQRAYRFDVSGWPYARVNMSLLESVDEQWWEDFIGELIAAFNYTIRRIAAPHEFP